MKAIILAAGFGERLYPQAKHMPKALLEVGGMPVIDHILSFLSAAPEVEHIHIRTNARYYPLFKDWLRDCNYMGKVELSSNSRNEPAEKMGAVGDLEDVCARKQLQEDLLVLAGDNIFQFQIAPFLEFCSKHDGDVAVVLESGSKKELNGGGVVELTSDRRVIHFEEKPSKPRSHLLSLPLYRLSAESIPFLTKYKMEGNDCDRIGSFFAWSYRRRPLYAFIAEGTRYHLTDAASYKKIRSTFEKKQKS
jgi:glucose-1-phosphate thymidylyltransferase